MKTLKYLTFGLMVASATISHAQQIDLSLQEALRLAKEKNKTIQIQYMEEKIADGSIKEAKSALLPTIGLNGVYQYYFDRQVIFMPGSFVGNENQPVADVAVGGKNAISANIYLQQALINESARRHIKSARLESALQNQKTREVESDIILRISENYFTIQLLQTSIGLHSQSLERNQQALKDSRSLYHQGKALKVDTLRNYIAVENLHSTLSYLTNQLEIHMLNIKNDLGLTTDATLTITDSLTLEEPLLTSPFSNEEALTSRPDIQQGRIALDVSKSHLQQSRAMRLPTLSLVGSYQFQAQADNRNFDTYNWPRTSFVGVQASVPIFTGNRINAKVNQSNWRLKQSQATLQQLEENAITEKASLENELREAFKQAAIQKKTVEAASLSYQMISERYQNGLSSRLELTDAELALTAARMNQLNAYYRVNLTTLQLKKALGKLEF